MNSRKLLACFSNMCFSRWQFFCFFICSDFLSFCYSGEIVFFFWGSCWCKWCPRGNCLHIKLVGIRESIQILMWDFYFGQTSWIVNEAFLVVHENHWRDFLGRSRDSHEHSSRVLFVPTSVLNVFQNFLRPLPDIFSRSSTHPINNSDWFCFFLHCHTFKSIASGDKKGTLSSVLIIR